VPAEERGPDVEVVVRHGGLHPLLLRFPQDVCYESAAAGRMASPISSRAMWGFGDLVRELRVDPEQVQRRFGISPGAEHEDDALISVVAVAAEAAAGARDEDDLFGE